MNLGELLSELRENILHDRSDRVDGASDFLWSDATLVRYINEAQRRFARRALILRDGRTPEVTRVTLLAGQSEYVLHDSVVAVISARLSDDERDLQRIGHSLFSPRQEDAPQRGAIASSLQPGRPLMYSTDETLAESDTGTTSTVVLKVFPTPTAAEVGLKLYLRVVRLPLQMFKVNRLNDKCEIPEDYQLQMLDWAAYLALRISDVDAGDQRGAAAFRQSFEVHVSEARSETMRKLFVPSPMQTGGRGFVWDRG